ncbi:MAG: DMT family transporter [Bacteroidetes bacterium]|nr:DMT family transporter [Bacteroidota bacterium]
MNYLGEISALLTALLWALSSYFFAAATLRVGSVTVNFTRLLFSLILILITIPVFSLPVDLSLYQYVMLMASGVAGLVLGDSFFFKSLEYLTTRVSVLITSFAPGVSAVLAFVFLGERLPFLSIVGMAISLSGILMVVTGKHEHNDERIKKGHTKKGIALAFLYTIGQASGLIFAKFAFEEKEVNSMVATAVRIFPAVALLLPYFLYKVKTVNLKKIFNYDKKAFYNVAAATVLSAYIGMVLMFVAVTQTKVAIASTIMASIPIIQLGISKFLYKEKLTWRSITGAFITVGGMVLLFWK